MREHFSQALQAFEVRGKEVALWMKTPSWCEEMLRESGAILGTRDRPAQALILLSQLKKLQGEEDFTVMHIAKSLVEPKGLLYLSIPVGKEKIVEGSHRVYGEKRMKELFKGWRPVGYFGYSYEDLLNDPVEIHEPVFVLRARV